MHMHFNLFNYILCFKDKTKKKTLNFESNQRRWKTVIHDTVKLNRIVNKKIIIETKLNSTNIHIYFTLI